MTPETIPTDLAAVEHDLRNIIMDHARVSDISFAEMNEHLNAVTQLVNELEQFRNAREHA